MTIQCNQYPYPNNNSALAQFLAHHNCEDLDPIDNPSAVPTALQAPSDDTHTTLSVLITQWKPSATNHSPPP